MEPSNLTNQSTHDSASPQSDSSSVMELDDDLLQKIINSSKPSYYKPPKPKNSFKQPFKKKFYPKKPEPQLKFGVTNKFAGHNCPQPQKLTTHTKFSPHSKFGVPMKFSAPSASSSNFDTFRRKTKLELVCEQLDKSKKKKKKAAELAEKGEKSEKDKEKEEMVNKVLQRWWYALDDWPPANYDYRMALKENKLRLVRESDWEDEPRVDALGNEKVLKLRGYTGVYFNNERDLLDLRPYHLCPSYDNLMKKKWHDIQAILIKALTNQIEELKVQPFKDPQLLKELNSELTFYQEMLQKL